MKIHQILFVVAGLGFLPNAQACPEKILRMTTQHLTEDDLCSLYDRYQHALEQLDTAGLRPARRVANLMAPRFIDMPDWLAKRKDDAEAVKKIYAPAPITWGQWDQGSQILDTFACENEVSDHVPLINEDWLKTIHGVALNGLIHSAGAFRSGQEIGMSFSKTQAVTEEQIQDLEAKDYPSALGAGALKITFQPTICFEDQTPEFQKKVIDDQAHARFVFHEKDWTPIPADQFFTDAKGVKKQCGYFQYPDLAEVKPQMERYVQSFNNTVADFNSERPQLDPIRAAAKAQRWMIVIHPYERGNGRMSRFVMDYVLESLGLPAPQLKEMNDDYITSEKGWADEIGRGMQRTVEAAEACVKNPRATGCAVIPEDAPETTKPNP